MGRGLRVGTVRLGEGWRDARAAAGAGGKWADGEWARQGVRVRGGR
jgi:hypothetical protein